MATPYFPTLLILLSLSSFTLLILSLLPTVSPSIPFSSSSPPSPWPSPSCGLGQSWAVQLHAVPHHEEELGSAHLDAIANTVQNFMNTFCWYNLIFRYGLNKAQELISLFWYFHIQIWFWRATSFGFLDTNGETMVLDNGTFGNVYFLTFAVNFFFQFSFSKYA